MDWTRWLGDLHQVPSLSPPLVGVLTIAVAAVCGAIVGLEREKREKPAGLRTLILICVGSAIFTMASLLVGDGVRADRARIAAQVVTGIGFLGAGAIIHERRAVVGLTTAATIWSVAAIGVVVGFGYAAAGVVLSFFIFLILSFLRLLEGWMSGPCRRVTARVRFRPEQGKTVQLLLAIIDDHHLPHSSYRFFAQTHPEESDATADCAEIEHCCAHRAHRMFLSEIAALPEVEAIEQVGRGQRQERVLERSQA